MALDQATQNLLAEMAKMDGKPIHESTPQEARELSGKLKDFQGDGPTMVEEKWVKIDVEDGSIDAHILKPSHNPDGVLVYYHGGGWVIGKASDFEVLGKKLAQQANTTVILIDYRKAPEHPFPVGINDSYIALKWVEYNIEEIAGKEVPLIIAGDSAGGNICAVLALKARDHSGPKIAMQILIYPVTDHNFENGTYSDPENQLMLEKQSMIWFWDHYLSRVEDRNTYEASPAQAKNFSGLPPAVVITAGHDVLREEGEKYASKLIEAGVSVKFKRFPDQMHGFFTMANILPGSDAALHFIQEAIRSYVAEQNTLLK